ncbi:hypothetical protein [Mesorhizobium sp. CAU 1741]|uniref:hypothetical protein n=1 Tax=Mesorhizobium sp. CAU 1741 TaxID=3140366 RepID=UPI00325BAFF1
MTLESTTTASKLSAPIDGIDELELNSPTDLNEKSHQKSLKGNKAGTSSSMMATTKSNTVLDLPSNSTRPTDRITKGADGNIIIPPSLEKEMSKAADQIRKLHGTAIANIVGIGAHLLKMKAQLKHGEFARWYEREFGWNAMTVNRRMNAAQAWMAIRKCVPEAKLGSLPPTLLYDYGKLTSDQQREVALAAKSGSKIKADDFKKSPEKNAAKSPPVNSNNDAAEELARLITDALPLSRRREIANHSGFRAASFGQTLQKGIARSFGASSNMEAA